MRHLPHAADSTAESVPEEPFEALLARLDVEFLEQAKVKELSDVCAKLGVPKTGKCLLVGPIRPTTLTHYSHEMSTFMLHMIPYH